MSFLSGEMSTEIQLVDSCTDRGLDSCLSFTTLVRCPTIFPHVLSPTMSSVLEICIGYCPIETVFTVFQSSKNKTCVSWLIEVFWYIHWSFHCACGANKHFLPLGPKKSRKSDLRSQNFVDPPPPPTLYPVISSYIWSNPVISLRFSSVTNHSASLSPMHSVRKWVDPS